MLDSWPLLETLRRGREVPLLRALLREAAAGQTELFLSEINLGEVFYNIARDRGTPAADRLMEQFSLLPIQIVAPKAGDGLLTGKFKALWNISVADCFCVILAERFDAALVTGDDDFRKAGIETLIKLEWLGA